MTMTTDERILYTFLIRILHKHSCYSRFADTDSPVNKFLSAKEIFAILKEDAKDQPALHDYLKAHPSLSPKDVDDFLASVCKLEYPKEVIQTYFNCNTENSEGKTIKYLLDGNTLRYALPKRRKFPRQNTMKAMIFLF